MQAKHVLGAVGLTAALAGGGLLGATLGVPSITGAQTDPGTTQEADPGPPDGRGPRWRPDLGVAAEALGVTEDELRQALRDGQSMADVAAEEEVDVQTVIDALVADATTRIDEAVADGDLEADRAEELKAELPDRIADVVNGEGFGPGGPGRGPGCDGPADGEGGSEGEAPAQSEGSSFTA